MKTARRQRSSRPAPSARARRTPRPPGRSGGNAPRHPQRRSGCGGGRGQTRPAGVHAGRRRARLPRAHRIHERRGADADGGRDDSLRQPVLRPDGQMPAGAGDGQFLSPLSLRRRPGHAPTAPETGRQIRLQNPGAPACRRRFATAGANLHSSAGQERFQPRDHRHGGDGHDGGPAQRGTAAGLVPPRGASAGSRARARGPRIARQHHPASLRHPRCAARRWRTNFRRSDGAARSERR